MPLDAQPDMSFYASDAGLPGLYRGTNFLGRPTAVPIVGTTGLGLGSGASATPSGGGGSLGGGAGAFGTPGTAPGSFGSPSASEGPTSGAGTSISQATGGGRPSAGTAATSGAALGLSSASLAALLADKILGGGEVKPGQDISGTSGQPSTALGGPAPFQATDPITGAPLTGAESELVPSSVPGGSLIESQNLPEQFFGPSQAEKFSSPATISETPSLEPPIATPPSTEAPTTPPVDPSSLGTGLAAGAAGSYVLHQLPLEPRLATESALTIASLAVPPLAPFALGNLIPDLIGLFNPNSLQFPSSTFDALGTSVRNVLPPTLPIPSGATPEQRAAIQAANDKIATLEPYAYGQTGMGDRPSTLSGEQSPETWQNSLNQVVSSTIQPAFNDLGKLYPAALQAFASTQQSNPEWQPLLSALQSGDMNTARNLLFTAQSPTAQAGIARLRMQDVGVPYFEQQAEQSLSPEGTWPQFAPTAGGGAETMPNPFETSAPGPVGSDLQSVAKDIWSGYLPNYGAVDNANPLIPATANYAGTFPYNQPLLNLTEDALKAGIAGGPQFYVS